MRKRAAKNFDASPDPRYKDMLVAKFINNLMLDGKKSVAYKLFYDAMDIVDGKTEDGGYATWKKALDNAMPSVEVRSRRIGGATFQIPVEVRANRKIAKGMKWLIRFARERNGKGMSEKLAAELMAAANGEGGSIKKKEDTHRMAEANKAFSHFRI